MPNLKMVEGIGPKFAAKLESIGVKSTGDLLEKGGTAKGRKAIEAASGLSGALILKWVNHVDLFRVKGVGEEYADLLEASGVDTVVELAKRKGDNLAAKMAEVNAKKKLVRQLPSVKQVEKWIAHAKTLPRKVSY